MSSQDSVTYTFELKDLSYLDLYTVYKEMTEFITFLQKSKDSAEVIKEEKEES